MGAKIRALQGDLCDPAIEVSLARGERGFMNGISSFETWIQSLGIWTYTVLCAKRPHNSILQSLLISQYNMLSRHKTYQHDHQSLLINVITIKGHQVTVM